MSSLLLKNGTLITAAETFQADILVEGETIAQIGPSLAAPDGARVVDASGKLILPGGVDVHTHFDLPMAGTVSADDHYTGHKAAAFGGTTTVIDFVSQDTSPLLANVEAWHAKADPKAAIDFGFHMNITHFDAQVAEEIGQLPGAGITSVKVFTAYNNRLRISDGDIYQVMRLARKHGLLTLVHAENGDVIETLIAEAQAAGRTTPEWHALTRPAWGAVEATLRSAAMAAQADAPVYIVHMNAGGEVDQLAYARSRGVAVMGETCPQYLTLNTADLVARKGFARCEPALRDQEDRVRFSGYDVANIKIFIFCVAAAISAIGGAMFTLQVGFMSPSFVGVVPSIEMVIFAAVGGRYSLIGAVYGALLVNAAKTMFSESFPEPWLYLMGGLFIGAVLLFPRGLAGLVERYGPPLMSALGKRLPAPALRRGAPAVRSAK